MRNTQEIQDANHYKWFVNGSDKVNYIKIIKYIFSMLIFFREMSNKPKIPKIKIFPIFADLCQYLSALKLLKLSYFSIYSYCLNISTFSKMRSELWLNGMKKTLDEKLTDPDRWRCMRQGIARSLTCSLLSSYSKSKIGFKVFNCQKLTYFLIIIQESLLFSLPKIEKQIKKFSLSKSNFITLSLSKI